jgi:hypothetical protein
VLTRAPLGPLLAGAIALLAIGCAQRSDRPPTLDGVYRTTVSAEDLGAIDVPDETAPTPGSWTLVVDHGRFAITQDGGGHGCTWAYGALGLGDPNVMSWIVIDAGAVPAGVAAAQPGDGYRFAWSRYRDVLSLSAARGGTSGYFAVRPWRRIAETPAASGLSTRCPPPAGALQPTGAEHATPSQDAAISFTGDLGRTAPTTWEGTGTASELGRGRLTLTGAVSFSSDQTRRRLTFAARFPKGELRGCAITTITLRPHRRYLWQGDGQITRTSPGLHGYTGLAVSLGGLTTTDALTRLHGTLRSDSAQQRASTAPPGDRC